MLKSGCHGQIPPVDLCLGNLFDTARHMRCNDLCTHVFFTAVSGREPAAESKKHFRDSRKKRKLHQTHTDIKPPAEAIPRDFLYKILVLQFIICYNNFGGQKSPLEGLYNIYLIGGSYYEKTYCTDHRLVLDCWYGHYRVC